MNVRSLTRAIARCNLLILGSTAGVTFSLLDTQPARADGEIEEIVVTARKRSESLQEVPDSITVLTSEGIENAGVDNLENVGTLVPNMSVRSANNSASMLIAMRGINATRNTEASVAVVIDGVQATNFLQFSQGLADIEQIEILKGPQGSLYGRNALGGAINIVTKQPGDDFEGRFSTTIGNGGKGEAVFSLSGPLIADKLYYRLSASYDEFDGVIHNPTLNEEVDYSQSSAGKLQLRYLPTDDLTLNLYASYSQTDAAVYNWIRLDPNDSNNDANSPKDYDSEPWGNLPGVDDYSFADITVKADYDFSDKLSLTSVTSYTETRDSWNGRHGQPIDLDFSELDIIGCECRVQNYDSLSQELRLSGGDEGFDWLFGLYYLDQESFTQQKNIGNFGSGRYNIFVGPGSKAEFDNKSYAVFGQANYDLTEKTALTLGLRYDRNKREQTDLILNQDFDDTFSMTQPKISLSHQLSDDLMLYGTVSSGFRAGGFNSAAGGIFARQFDSEELWNYEIGAKSTLFDGMMTLNGAAYHTVIDDHHEFAFDLSVPGPAVYNIPEAEITGVELEITAQPIANLDITAGLSWMDSEIKKFDADATGFDPDIFPVGNPFAPNDLPPADMEGEGNKLILVPHESFNLSLQYTIEMGEWSLIPRIDYAYEGEKYWFLDNQVKPKPTQLVNTSLTIRNADSLTFRLWGNNVLDEQYFYEYQHGFQVGAPFEGSAYKAPGRTYGLSLTYDF